MEIVFRNEGNFEKKNYIIENIFRKSYKKRFLQLEKESHPSCRTSHQPLINFQWFTKSNQYQVKTTQPNQTNPSPNASRMVHENF